jgi:hypothetical protein
MSLREDVQKARYDVEFFANRFLGIQLHPGQVALTNAYLARNMRSQRWWIAAYLTICLSAGNRAGKTLVMAVIILHSCFYKMGLKPPDLDDERDVARWTTLPYVAYHFAIQQDVARLVFDEINNMLQAVHVAQKDGRCPLVSELGVVIDTSKKDGGEYDYIVFDPSWGGAEIKFRTTQGGKGKGSLGRDMNLVTFDEAGIEPNLKWIDNNVIHLRRLGTGGQVFYFSTPEEGLNDFADFWFMGDPEQPDRNPSRMSLRMSTRDNIGYGLDRETFDSLVAGMDEDHIAQNIDGYFIQGRTAYFNANSVDRAFVEGLLGWEDIPSGRFPREMERVRPGQQYVQGVDPAIKVDGLWSITFRVWDEKAFDERDKEWRHVTRATGVKVERQRGRKTVDGIVDLATSVHLSYNRPLIKATCITAIDSTAMGGHMFRDLLDQSIPGGIRSVEFGGTTQKKRKLLDNLRTMLDKGWLQMPRSGIWLEVRRQLLGYKLDDGNIETDAVMALAVAVSVIRTLSPGQEASTPFNAFDIGVPVIAPMFNPRKRRVIRG